MAICYPPSRLSTGNPGTPLSECACTDNLKESALAAFDNCSSYNESFHSRVASYGRQSEHLKLFGKPKSSHWKGIVICEQSTSKSFGSSIQNGRDGQSTVSWGHQVTPKSKNIPTPAAVATAARLAYEEEEEAVPWRLDGKLSELKKLRDMLMEAKSLEQKLQLLDRNPRVRAVFGNLGRVGLYINPIVALASETLGEYEIYLLKSLVAGGQEHVLNVTPAWLDQFEESMQKEALASASQNGAHSSDKNFVKDAFAMLLNLIIQGVNSAELQPAELSNVLLSMHSPGSNGSIVKKSGIRANGLSRDVSTGQEISRQMREEPYEDLLREHLIPMLERLIKTVREMETFYDSIGGIVGYQAIALELIKAAEKEQHSLSSGQRKKVSPNGGPASNRFFVPVGHDLSRDKDYAAQAAVWGLESLPEMGEIYPLGGAGDRLGLVDDVTGECLPVAMLPYCGRTLLEGLIRDLQAREYLYFKLFGRQYITPVAIMTSAAKRNNDRVISLCESRGWFGRGKANFCLFEQPLVPAVAAEDGHWLMSEPLVPILKPGGHGVIWKLAYDKGVFDWFFKKGRKAAIVRQISNPIAATDVTLLALSGVGHRHKKKLGFASCERNVGTAEGVNVLVERSTKDGWEYGVTGIEYTEFNKLGIPDVPVSPGSMQAQYPANTNVLYVDLLSVKQIASSRSSASLPGMILNLKKPIVFEDYLGVAHSTRAGRIECTMQNVADFLLNKYQSRLSCVQYDNLDTFVIYNQRRKVTSSAKRRRKPTDFSLHQTPDGSFLDVTRNAYDLLTSCMVDMPEMESNQCYIDSGPPFIVLLHPALGPLWDIVRQKIHGGFIAKGSELQLEIAEFFWKDVQLDGSLVIYAENAVGTIKNSKNEESILHYGEGCGRCRLQRVQIVNRGVDWSCKENVYWQHKVQRLECLKIILHGNSEFEAHDVKLEGSHTFEVPDGYKMCVTKASTGFSCALDRLPEETLPRGTWYWNYSLRDGAHVHLALVES